MKCLEVFQVAIGEKAARHRNANAARLILGVALINIKAFIVDVLEQPLNDLAVGTVVKGKAAVSVDGEGIHFVVECGRTAVFCGNAEPVGNGLYQAFALRTLRADCNRHFSDLLAFGSHILASGPAYIQLYLHIYGVDSDGAFSPQNCAYHTMLALLFVIGRYLTKLVFFAFAQHADLFIRADLLDIPADNDITELFVQFDGAADAVGLFTGNER